MDTSSECTELSSEGALDLSKSRNLNTDLHPERSTNRLKALSIDWPIGVGISRARLSELLVERHNSIDIGSCHMFVDSHCHIFTNRIVQNVRDNPAMIEELKLNTHDALPRLEPKALEESARANNVAVCVLLPTAAPQKVRSENDRFIQFTQEFPRLRTLATLHPNMRQVSEEIVRMFDSGINGFKFSSFSQRFDLLSPEVEVMLTEVERLGPDREPKPLLVFDTYARADVYFSAHPDHLTTPFKLVELAHRHQGINFVCAHMGGLLADFDEVRRILLPAPNIFLDTANAAHTLKENQFIELLQLHGPSHILFGTDWPWFVHRAERSKIDSLLVKAGYNKSEKAAVFGGNAERLFGL